VTLTIWGRLNSHNVKKVVWLAEEIGLPYVRHDIGGKFGMDEAYLRKNPNALIPTIEDGDFILWESNTILRYLAAKYAPDTFWHADPQARALVERWMDWHFNYARSQLPAFLNLVRHAPENRDAEAISTSTEEAGRLMGIVDATLAKQPWLSGQTFGLGDIPMGVHAYSWFSLDIPRPDYPHVSDWYARLRERPGYAQYVMIPLS
jgi:glutathione S-transferase